MKQSSLESKTIRPGLGAYSFYYSDRHPGHAQAVTQDRPKSAKRSGWKVIAILAIILMTVAYLGFKGDNHTVSNSQRKTDASIPVSAAKPAPAVVMASKINRCANNSLTKQVIIDISDRHLWACEGNTIKHDSSIISGIEGHESTISPRGTFKIYAKVKDTVLTGSDETGSWKRQVGYWMPYLDNQYGTYGFHDATWRSESEFGKVDPNTDKASHGCVELPLATSAWLFNWTEVGTPVTVQS
jgi:lipoprotein-anchoring transpeptidase ErfK/SrfK